MKKSDLDQSAAMRTAPPSDDGYPNSSARRRWITGWAAASGVAASPLTEAAARSNLAFRPAVFDASDGGALVNVFGVRAIDVHVRWAALTARDPLVLTERSKVVSLTATTDFSAAIELQNLPAATTIAYAVYAGDSACSDIQRFRTPPAPSARSNFTLAFSGDVEARCRPFRVFDSIAAKAPDCFLHLGDTVYADIPRREFSPTLEHYRRKHTEIRSDRSLQSFLANTATVAIWDDHEIENDANGSHPAIDVADRVFREYWPVRAASGASASASDRKGLFRQLSFGKDLDLFVLDTRSFRSPQADAQSANKTMLGTGQREWFRRAYRASSARYRLIATSVPFHGSSQDAWGNYEHERDDLIALFRDAFERHQAKTVLLSADYHFAREWPRNERHGIYEFMAGPLASFASFSRDAQMKARHSRGSHFVYGEGANFGLLHYDAGMDKLRVSYFDDGGNQLFTRDI